MDDHAITGVVAVVCTLLGLYAWLAPLPSKPNGPPPDDDAGSDAWESRRNARLSGLDRKLSLQRWAIGIGLAWIAIHYLAQ